jgi:AP-5 complex subunit mu-1
LEVALPVNIFFDGDQTTTLEDPFLIEENSYILVLTRESSPYFHSTYFILHTKLHFKILDDSLSGVTIDSKTLSIFPNPRSKIQVSTDREIKSGEYIIWNSLGKAKHALPNT